MNLHLVLTYHWYDEILNGKKWIEYRELKQFWIQRIWEKRHEIETVTFSRGYTSQTIAFNVNEIKIGPCPIAGWDGDYIQIHFKDIT